MDSSFKFADLNNDKHVMDMISVLEKELTEKTGKKIILVAFDGK
jgi:hypothetical protein